LLAEIAWQNYFANPIRLARPPGSLSLWRNNVSQSGMRATAYHDEAAFF
jgi:hypothetical protein